MRVLLDNCVNHRFGPLLRGHEVVHARELGWSELKNGELVSAAETAGFPVMVTTDKQMQHQQNLSGRSITVVVLGSKRLTLRYIAPAEKVLADLEVLRPGEFVIVYPDQGLP